MFEIENLYQDLIIDHSRSPRNFGKLLTANLEHEGYNPLCGDKVIIYLQQAEGKILEIKFEGCGCAISMASASLMTEILKGKNKQELVNLFALFHQLVTTGQTDNPDSMQKLIALAGVSEFPMRVKCATLAWHTALAAFNKINNP
ncbi:MAG: SUF system NifU family Fe-S cluster assembly protein [Proteobacteria bacterium]|nr:SUF system NifU family Fe-S cluster assembly protein [Pseudomonadota bacterium]